jgi:hypothetical protein
LAAPEKITRSIGVLISRFSITPLFHYSREKPNSKETFEALFQGAKAKPGLLRLDALLHSNL